MNTYMEKDNSKFYVKELIQDHELWSEPRFWEEMFFEAYCQEVGHQRVFTLKRWMSEEEQHEIRTHNQRVLFGQLSSFAHSMKLFNIRKEDVIAFIHKMSRLHNLGEEELQQLYTLLN